MILQSEIVLILSRLKTKKKEKEPFDFRTTLFSFFMRKSGTLPHLKSRFLQSSSANISKNMEIKAKNGPNGSGYKLSALSQGFFH